MSGRGRPVILVVPCFNESTRLPTSELEALTSGSDVGLVLVDDGSTDSTHDLLSRLAADLPATTVLRLGANSGKAEAVRQGLLRALGGDPEVVGFVDADFATPASEMHRLVERIRQTGGPAILIASRVLLSGRTIVRRPARHVVGRVVATYLSLAYSLTVYDTQCGAKLFRVDDRLRAALATPFVTKWLFDVELLLRVRESAAGGVVSVREEPLEIWRDVPGSRLRGREAWQVLKDFAALRRRHGRKRTG